MAVARNICVLAGGLSLAVEGPSKAEIVCQDNDDGTCTVTYLPTEPGLYNVVVKFDDEHILGSPFTSYIAGRCMNSTIFRQMTPTTGYRFSPNTGCMLSALHCCDNSYLYYLLIVLYYSITYALLAELHCKC